MPMAISAFGHLVFTFQASATNYLEYPYKKLRIAKAKVQLTPHEPYVPNCWVKSAVNGKKVGKNVRW